MTHGRVTRSTLINQYCQVGPFQTNIRCFHYFLILNQPLRRRNSRTCVLICVFLPIETESVFEPRPQEVRRAQEKKQRGGEAGEEQKTRNDPPETRLMDEPTRDRVIPPRSPLSNVFCPRCPTNCEACEDLKISNTLRVEDRESLLAGRFRPSFFCLGSEHNGQDDSLQGLRHALCGTAAAFYRSG